jgi:hypothetical protein
MADESKFIIGLRLERERKRLRNVREKLKYNSVNKM